MSHASLKLRKQAMEYTAVKLNAMYQEELFILRDALTRIAKYNHKLCGAPVEIARKALWEANNV